MALLKLLVSCHIFTERELVYLINTINRSTYISRYFSTMCNAFNHTNDVLPIETFYFRVLHARDQGKQPLSLYLRLDWHRCFNVTRVITNDRLV